MPLREQLTLEPLEPPDRLVEEAADLCDVAGDGEDLGADAVADGAPDLRRDRRLELGRGGGESLDLPAGALERRLQLSGPRPALRRPRRCAASPVPEPVRPWARGYSQRRMDTALLDYDLPQELVAQHPLEPRDASRLLVYRRASGEIEHRSFAELPDLLEDELVVVNDTRVVPARLELRRATGGRVEVLLLERGATDGVWEGLARPSRRLRAGERLGPVELLEPLGDGRWLLRLDGEPDGEMPLPPYIHERLADPERYQTVYARAEATGSAAAPTAGPPLHAATCWTGSIPCASRCTSGSTRLGR